MVRGGAIVISVSATSEFVTSDGRYLAAGRLNGERLTGFEGVKPTVLYFTGATDNTVVALAGPLRRMVGADREEARVRPLQRFIIHEPRSRG